MNAAGKPGQTRTHRSVVPATGDSGMRPFADGLVIYDWFEYAHD